MLLQEKDHNQPCKQYVLGKVAFHQTSTIPLVSKEKADEYLYLLRYRTIAETRQMTRTEELVTAAKDCGMDENAFLSHMQDGSAVTAFEKDLRYTRSLGITSLPVCLVQYEDNAVLISQLTSYSGFQEVIAMLSKDTVKAYPVFPSAELFHSMLKKHPLISKQELLSAMNCRDEDELHEIIRNTDPSLCTVTHGGFIQRRKQYANNGSQ